MHLFNGGIHFPIYGLVSSEFHFFSKKAGGENKNRPFLLGTHQPWYETWRVWAGNRVECEKIGTLDEVKKDLPAVCQIILQSYNLNTSSMQRRIVDAQPLGSDYRRRS